MQTVAGIDSMLITFLIALILLIALLFLGCGFLAWVGAAGVWLVGWRIAGVDSPLCSKPASSH